MSNVEVSRVVTEKFKSEVSCTLTPFSFFKSKHYFVFRVKDLVVYRVYVEQDFIDIDGINRDRYVYTEFLTRLKEELYSESQSNAVIADVMRRVTNLEEYLHSNDVGLVRLGTDLLKSFIQGIKIELGYTDEE